jgi:hypothetical protein
MRKLKPEHLLSKQMRYARKTREALIIKLGGKCAKAGQPGASPCEGALEFDHFNGRDYNPNKLSSSARMARYKREAERGELQLLCAKHNLEARVKNDNGKFLRTEHAEEVCRTSHMAFARGGG